MTNKIEINIKTFIIAAVLILAAYLSTRLVGIFVILFVAFIIFSALKPVVDFLERRKVKRIFAIFITYIVILGIFFLIFSFLFNETVSQIRIAAKDFQFNYENIIQFVDVNLPFLSDDIKSRIFDIQVQLTNSNFLQTLTTNEAFRSLLGSLDTVGNQGLKFVSSALGGLFTVFMIIFISIYMILPKSDFYEGAINYFPKKYSNRVNKVMDRVRTGLGSWLIGQIILMFIIGFATYIIIATPGLFIENYEIGKFAFLLAVVAGILEGVPNIGPILTLVVTLIIAVLVGSPTAIIIYFVVTFIILQQAEGLLLVPVVMKKAIELDPIISIVAVLAGFELTKSPIGSLLAIPIVGALKIVVVDILDNWKKD